MYRPDCPSARGLRGLLCLSLVGWLFTIFCTYTGFACMVWGEWPLVVVVIMMWAAWCAACCVLLRAKCWCWQLSWAAQQHMQASQQGLQARKGRRSAACLGILTATQTPHTCMGRTQGALGTSPPSC